MDILSKNDVAGVVRRDSMVVGLNENIWLNSRYSVGMVPVSQSMRLVIAKTITLRLQTESILYRNK